MFRAVVNVQHRFVLWTLVAWYDYDLKGYQQVRQGELQRRFDERQTTAGSVEATDLIRRKEVQETETEWQQQVKKKKNDEYYKNLKEVNAPYL